MSNTFQPIDQFGGTVLGSFSKGVAGAASLNFGRSGGVNCDTGCRHHPANFAGADSLDGFCYAVEVELRHDRVQLKNKLDRHEQTIASRIVAKALLELEREEMYGRPPRPWFRFSTNGALPSPADALADRPFLPRMRALLAHLKRRGTPVHLPVESAEKAVFYREQLGADVIVRESIQTPHMNADTIAAHAIPAGPCSFTAGEDVGNKPGKRMRILAAADAAAKAWAKLTGRRTIVCPAVRVSFLSRCNAGKGNRTPEQLVAWREGAKCGSCPGCSRDVDVVYPAH
jgi:hypothetical protein